MKSHCLLLLVFVLLSSIVTKAQEIPNSGFENWSSINYFEEPDPYSTSNSLSYLFGDTANVTKTTDSYSGTYAARLETMEFGTDTVPGVIMIGQLSGSNIIGGVPYTQRPDSLAGYVKYNLQGGDELYIICLFTRQGLPLGGIETTYSGTVNNYTRISIPINWFIPILTPDSLKVVITNTSTIVSGHPGSTVYLDHFQFIGASSPFPNGEFETWNLLSAEEPDDWTTLNYVTATSSAPYATKSNDKHSGNWAIRIENTVSFFGETIGFLTNGAFQGYNWISGMQVDQNPSLISGYYKYLPEGIDTAQVAVSTFWYDITGDTNVLVEQQVINLAPAGSYTYFEVPLEYHANPIVDTVNIAFSAGIFGGGMQPGSTLFLDDISIDYYPVSVPEQSYGQSSCTVFPNPCYGDLIIVTGDNRKGPADIQLYDLAGRPVIHEKMVAAPGKTFELDLHHLEPGLYFYRIRGNDWQSSGKVILDNKGF